MPNNLKLRLKATDASHDDGCSFDEFAVFHNGAEVASVRYTYTDSEEATTATTSANPHTCPMIMSGLHLIACVGLTIVKHCSEDDTFYADIFDRTPEVDLVMQ